MTRRKCTTLTVRLSEVAQEKVSKTTGVDGAAAIQLPEWTEWWTREVGCSIWCRAAGGPRGPYESFLDRSIERRRAETLSTTRLAQSTHENAPRDSLALPQPARVPSAISSSLVGVFRCSHSHPLIGIVQCPSVHHDASPVRPSSSPHHVKAALFSKPATLQFAGLLSPFASAVKSVSSTLVASSACSVHRVLKASADSSLSNLTSLSACHVVGSGQHPAAVPSRFHILGRTAQAEPSSAAHLNFRFRCHSAQTVVAAVSRLHCRLPLRPLLPLGGPAARPRP